MNHHDDDDEPPQTTLPEDLIEEEIMSRLPVKSLMRFKCVSKNWRCTISSKQFCESHLRTTKSSTNKTRQLRSGENLLKLAEENDHHLFLMPFDDELEDFVRVKFGDEFDDEFITVDFVGSCNGLLCLYINYDDADGWFALWNPATRQYREFEDPDDEYFPSSFGFGYVSSIDDYKIIAAFPDDDEDEDKDEVYFCVFSLNEGQWKRTENRGLRRNQTILIDDNISCQTSTIDDNKELGGALRYYNLADDRLVEIEPRCQQIVERMMPSSSVTRQWLLCNDAEGVDFWVWEKHGDGKNCWKKLPFADMSATRLKMGKCLLWRLHKLDAVPNSRNECSDRLEPSVGFSHVLDKVGGYYETLVSPFRQA